MHFIRIQKLKVIISTSATKHSIQLALNRLLHAVGNDKTRYLICRPLAWLERWVQILGMRNGEFEVYTEVHKNSSTTNDNEDAPDIESCKRSTEDLQRNFNDEATVHFNNQLR